MSLQSKSAHGLPVITSIAILLGALVLILASSELFTNGVEWLGTKLGVNEGVVGSVFAAVGTALPETLIPVVAVVAFRTPGATEVGIGAIAGAPFMLSTLTFGLAGAGMCLFAAAKIRAPGLHVAKSIFGRDLRFFILSYSLALIAGALHGLGPGQQVVAFLLVANYFWYLRKTFQGTENLEAPVHELYLARLLRTTTSLPAVWAQVLVGLLGILAGAYLFVEHMQPIAAACGVPNVILALIVAPIATELPEKVNSILWARQGKDTLALGNISGALVFQSCFPVAFGVAFTGWHLGGGTLATGVIAIGMACLYLYLLEHDKLAPQHFLCGILVYAGTMGWLVMSHAPG